MKRKIVVNKTTELLTDANYVASGGEAAIYRSASRILVYKLYHDATKATSILNKIQELKQIQSPNVLVPVDVVYDAGSGEPVGYSMPYLDNTDPLCKFFTKAFKIAQKVTPDQIKDLVTHLQKTLPVIHQANCLVVDLNELNVLVEQNRITTHVIDTDSFQTPSYPATAIMASIQDVQATKFSQLTDWYSWGILAFQAYVNIHPFRGSHPDYSPTDWVQRMRDNVSVFDKKVKLPPVCNPLSVIPKNHLGWFEAVFQKGERSVPPLADAIALPVPAAIQIVKSSGKFEVIPVQQYDSKIQYHLPHQGMNWVATQTEIYKGKATGIKINNKSRVRLVPTSDGELVIVTVQGNSLTFRDSQGTVLGTTTSVGGRCFVKNGALYTTASGHLVETTFVRVGTRTVPRAVDIDNVSELTAKLHEGIVVQDLLGEIYITVPYAKDKSKTVKLPEVKGYRVLEARAEKNIVVLVVEKGGTYYRLVLTFSEAYTDHKYRLTSMAQYASINFTVKPNGVTVLVSGLDEVEVFKGDKVAVFKNPPFDESMWLFNSNDNVYFVNDNQIYQVKIS